MDIIRESKSNHSKANRLGNYEIRLADLLLKNSHRTGPEVAGIKMVNVQARMRKLKAVSFHGL